MRSKNGRRFILVVIVQQLSCHSSRTAVQIDPHPIPPLTLRSHETLCSIHTAVGDSLLASVVQGGEAVGTSVHNGDVVVLRVSEVSSSPVADSTKAPQLRLSAISIAGRRPPRSLKPERVAFDLTIHLDSASQQLYMCILRSTQLYLGDHAFLRRR
jgi:hypothetical protein